MESSRSNNSQVSGHVVILRCTRKPPASQPLLPRAGALLRPGSQAVCTACASVPQESLRSPRAAHGFGVAEHSLPHAQALDAAWRCCGPHCLYTDPVLPHVQGTRLRRVKQGFHFLWLDQVGAQALGTVRHPGLSSFLILRQGLEKSLRCPARARIFDSPASAS